MRALTRLRIAARSLTRALARPSSAGRQDSAVDVIQVSAYHHIVKPVVFATVVCRAIVSAFHHAHTPPQRLLLQSMQSLSRISSIQRQPGRRSWLLRSTDASLPPVPLSRETNNISRLMAHGKGDWSRQSQSFLATRSTAWSTVSPMVLYHQILP